MLVYLEVCLGITFAPDFTIKSFDYQCIYHYSRL